MTRSPDPPRFLAAALIAAALSTPSAAFGHNEAPVAPTPVVQSPRAEAASGEFELVAVAKGPALVITLDRFATNQPIVDGTLDVAEGDSSAKAPAQGDGTYLLRAPWVEHPGHHDLTFTVRAGEASDLLIATIDIPDPHAAAASRTSMAPGVVARLLGAQRGSVTYGLTFLLGMLTMLALRARGRRRAAAGAAAIAVGLFTAGTAFAHPGAEDGPGPASATTDTPQRLPDGSVDMPKDAQRLLAVRTVVAARTRSARTIQIIGEVIADPAASGRVQGTQSGRIQPVDGELAHIGQAVRKGDPLAMIIPAISGVDRGGLQAQLADLEAQIRISERKVARLGGLAGSVAGKEIDDARTELAGLHTRRAALSPTLVQGEVLRAPVSGVVSVARVTIGQVVESRDVLFEIVDPSRLWVEAFAFDPAVAGQMIRASAETADGTPLAIELVGRSPTLRQGAIPMQFRIASPPVGLAVGAPVTVTADLATMDTGFALPRTAVVRMPNGGSAVWDHVTAERFVQHPVRLQPLDAGHVLVLAGLDPGQRIVVQGADLLNQVR